jgi:hypothetical protein
LVTQVFIAQILNWSMEKCQQNSQLHVDMD